MDYKIKYLKYKQKYLNCKNNLQNADNNYKTKYINIIDENIDIPKKCGNLLERVFTDKVKCKKNEYCDCEICKQKKSSFSECNNDYECDSYNCEIKYGNDKQKIGRYSPKVSLLKKLFFDD